MTGFAKLQDRVFNGYLRMKIPHPHDGTVAALVEQYRSLAPQARGHYLQSLNARAASILSAFGQRSAVLAVRSRSAEHLASGVVAAGLADAMLDDRRDNLYVLATLNDAAERLGLSLVDIVRECQPDIPEAAYFGFMDFCARRPPDKSITAFHLWPEGDGQRFCYVTHPG